MLMLLFTTSKTCKSTYIYNNGDEGKGSPFTRVGSLAAPAPSHNVRVWSASYIPSCTGLPKTGATNQNAPHLISEYLCLLRQRNDSNTITIVKETRELRDKE